MTTTVNIIPAYTGFCSCKTRIHYIPVNKMVPINRFNLDHSRITFLTDDKYIDEVFFIEANRKVSNAEKCSCIFGIHAIHGDYERILYQFTKVRPAFAPAKSVYFTSM